MAGVPLRRFAEGRNSRPGAVSLLGVRAQYITGAICVCDGGQSLLGAQPLPRLRRICDIEGPTPTLVAMSRKVGTHRRRGSSFRRGLAPCRSAFREARPRSRPKTYSEHLHQLPPYAHTVFNNLRSVVSWRSGLRPRGKATTDWLGRLWFTIESLARRCRDEVHLYLTTYCCPDP